MFQQLRQLLTKCEVQIEDLFVAKSNRLKGNALLVLKEIAEIINWRSSRSDLQKRIRKLASQTTFSVRDKKLLKKLVNKQRKVGEINFDDILYYFPGKSVETLKKYYYQKSSE